MCERLAKSAFCAGWQLKQVWFAFAIRTSDWPDCSAIGLGHSRHGTPASRGLEPIQKVSGPLLWHWMHIAFICSGSWVEPCVNATIVAEVGSFTWLPPGP